MDFDFNTSFDFGDKQERFIKPKKRNLVPAKKVVYENAEQLAKDIDIKKNDYVYCIVGGDFVFGDFIEAFISYYNFQIKELTISTLSMSDDNVDSLKNLLVWGNVKKLNLILSRFFYGHERAKLIPYIYQELDYDNKFQLAICDNHSKICQFETEQGNKCVMYGSANMRSSQNIEQFTITVDSDIYDFNQAYFSNIIDKYYTIKKSIGRNNLIELIKDVTESDEFNDNQQTF